MTAKSNEVIECFRRMNALGITECTVDLWHFSIISNALSELNNFKCDPQLEKRFCGVVINVEGC